MPRKPKKNHIKPPWNKQEDSLDERSKPKKTH